MDKTQKTRLTSSGELNDYMRVTTLPAWIIIAAIGTLLAGLLIWSIGGRLTSTVAAAATVREGIASLYVREADAPSITPGATAVIGDREMTLQGITPEGVPASSVMNPYTRLLLGVSEEDSVNISEMVTDLPDGNYNASVVVEKLRPISLLFGRKR